MSTLGNRDAQRWSRQADRLRHLARGRIGLACAALSTEDTGDREGDWRAGLHGSSDRSASLWAEAASLGAARRDANGEKATVAVALQLEPSLERVEYQVAG